MHEWSLRREGVGYFQMREVTLEEVSVGVRRLGVVWGTIGFFAAERLSWRLSKEEEARRGGVMRMSSFPLRSCVR